MSYPRDLSDYEDSALLKELDRRCQERLRGKCDYCGRDSNEPVCRMHVRHMITFRD